MSNITWHHSDVSDEQRKSITNTDPKVIWLTGLSGSGKSTIAHHLERELINQKKLCCVLDGDNVRHGLCADLGFSSEERTENIRRVTHVAKLMYDAGLIVIVSFISPFAKDRDAARNIIGDDFCEVFVDAPLSVCEKRDPKNLYKKVRSGEIDSFTGISSPYQAPSNPELHLQTDEDDVDTCVEKIISKVF